MISRSHGRALLYATDWGGNQARCEPVPETLDARSLTDEELMTRLLAKDSNALKVLFQRHSQLVRGIALRVLHDEGESEELVQDVFFSVFKSANRFDPSKGAAKGWISQVTFHRALDRKSYLDRRHFYLGTDINSLNNTLAAKTDLDREVGIKLKRIGLQKAFEELSEMQRGVIESFYFEGLRLQEIADKLREPLGNVRHHFYRGLEQLRKSVFIQNLREK